MNLPGTVAGNWRWRFRPHDLTLEISQRLQTLTRRYERAGKVAELTPPGGASLARP
jgi:4-alpha-glucanotransferase